MKVVHLALTASKCTAPGCNRPTRKVYASPDGWSGRACSLGHANLARKSAASDRAKASSDGRRSS